MMSSVLRNTGTVSYELPTFELALLRCASKTHWIFCSSFRGTLAYSPHDMVPMTQSPTCSEDFPTSFGRRAIRPTAPARMAAPICTGGT
jgi:hypothetical protein